MYALFTGYDYYPSGGWSDFKGTFPTIETALAVPRNDWYQIVDLTSAEIVREGRG